MKRMCRAAFYGLALPAFAFGGLIACDAETTNPDPITLKDLKVAKGLRILDSGNGNVKLTWSGSNNEEDFSGYNIFGGKWENIKSAVESAGVEEGETIELLDSEGEPAEKAKALLAAMSYNGTDLNTAGEIMPEEGEEADFGYYPIYTGDKETAVFPTCMPSATTGTVKCATKTDVDARSTFNGTTTFEQSGLDVGTKYCFIVLATLDGGTKVSNVSSELACVTPRYEVEVSLTGLEASGAPHKLVNIETTRAACEESRDDCTLETSDLTDETDFCPKDLEGSFCIEIVGGAIGLTGIKGTGIYKAGERQSGFNDLTLNPAPALTVDDNGYNSPGYSQPGHTEKVNAGDMYVLAEANAGADGFYYHWLHVTAVDSAAGTLSFTLRLSKATGQQ